VRYHFLPLISRDRNQLNVYSVAGCVCSVSHAAQLLQRYINDDLTTVPPGFLTQSPQLSFNGDADDDDVGDLVQTDRLTLAQSSSD